MIKNFTLTIILLLSSIGIAQTVNIEGDPYGGNPYASINDAIAASIDPNDVILISGIHTESVTVDKSLTLRGTDPTTDIIQGAASSGTGGGGIRPLFLGEGDFTISIENLGIRNGNIDNTASSNGNGGGIVVEKVTGLATLSNLIIQDNFTTRNGGAIGISGSNVLISGCTIRNNTSDLDGGAIIAAPNNASAIDININIEETLIDSNVGRNGGALFLNGNNDFGNDYLMNVNIINSTVSNNNATSPTGGNGGGAIFSAARPWTADTSISNITLMLLHATFYGNSHASLVKSGIQFGAAAPTNLSMFNSIVVFTEDIATKAVNFNNSITTNVVNCIFGGLEGAGAFSAIIDNAANNNVKGKTATFAGFTTGLSDQGGNTLVYAIDENSNSDDYCTATVPASVTLPNVDQRGYLREGTPDAGAFEFGGTFSINQITEVPEFNIYPNPTSELIHIEGINNTVKQVEFYSVLGQLKKESFESEINVSDLSSGIYLVRITTTDDQNITKRIIVK